MSEYAAREVAKAIDDWATSKGLARRSEHKELAAFVVKRIGSLLTPRVSTLQALLLDTDPNDPNRYTNPRLVDSGCSPEEDLWPEDEETGEIAEKAVADVIWHLPHPDAVPGL